MPLIGNDISPAFESLPTRQEFSGDGSTTTFSLDYTVGTVNSIYSKYIVSFFYLLDQILLQDHYRVPHHNQIICFWYSLILSLSY